MLVRHIRRPRFPTPSPHTGPQPRGRRPHRLSLALSLSPNLVTFLCETQRRWHPKTGRATDRPTDTTGKVNRAAPRTGGSCVSTPERPVLTAARRLQAAPREATRSSPPRTVPDAQDQYLLSVPHGTLAGAQTLTRLPPN